MSAQAISIARPSPDDRRDVFGAGAASALLLAAVDEVGQQDALPDVEGADPLGGVDLVAGEGEHVDLLGLHVDRNVADRLHRVGVEPDAPFAAELADLGDRLDGADLVIRVHDRHERRVGADGVRDLLRRDEAPLVHRQVGDLEALLFEGRAGVQHRVVLEHRRDDVFFALGGELVRRTLDRPVIALRAAAGEVDLVRLGAERGGGLFARILDGRSPRCARARRCSTGCRSPR